MNKEKKLKKAIDNAKKKGFDTIEITPDAVKTYMNGCLLGKHSINAFIEKYYVAQKRLKKQNKEFKKCMKPTGEKLAVNHSVEVPAFETYSCFGFTDDMFQKVEETKFCTKDCGDECNCKRDWNADEGERFMQHEKDAIKALTPNPDVIKNEQLFTFEVLEDGTNVLTVPKEYDKEAVVKQNGDYLIIISK